MKKKAVRRFLDMLCYAALFSLAILFQVFGQKVTRYEACTMVCTLAIKSSPHIAIRTFYLNTEHYYLLVEPLNLTTSIRKASGTRSCSTSWRELFRQYVPDPYIKQLCDAETTSASLQDAGIKHFRSQGRGIELTADLCPSKRGLNRDFFNKLIKAVGKEELPVPIAIAITGVWMEQHPDDFAWLQKLIKKKSISVTWINHSYHHRTKKKLGLEQNFLLRKGTDLDKEILLVEKALIEHGELPSVFFRFPGLVSSDSLVKRVISYGLIPVGCDAWLAKNQLPTDGSIVLVHANGNELKGIRRFFKLLREEKANIGSGQWSLFDLSKSVVDTQRETYQESQEEPAGQAPQDVLEDLDLSE